MQLSEDEDEDGLGGVHETSISYLTKENPQQQTSNKKFGSNFTRKTQTNYMEPPKSQLDQFNLASGRLVGKGSNQLTLRRGPISTKLL